MQSSHQSATEIIPSHCVPRAEGGRKPPETKAATLIREKEATDYAAEEADLSELLR